MKLSATCLFALLTLGLWTTVASAAGTAGGDKAKADKAEKADAPADADAAGAAPAGGADTSEGLDLSDAKDSKTGEEGMAAAAVRASTSLSWQDIVVVPRKRFLKAGRFELAPFTGISVNDILIRHYVFGVDLNYFLSNALWVGLQGDYYIKSLTDTEALLGLQYNRIPTLNKYLYGGSLNFGYVPIYGKFALFNRNILHWEIFASAGFGVTQTEIIPRTPGDATFTTTALTPNFAVGGRFFLFDWLTVNYAFRDYIILDKFEPTDRMQGEPIAAVKARAEGKLIQNVMFYVGVGVYLPTRFQYKTPR